MNRLSACLFALGLLVPGARATTVIDWEDPSVIVTTINSRHVRVTGFTTGDHHLRFTVDISTVNALLNVSFNPTGGENAQLNMNMPTPRNSLTLLTLTASLEGGVAMENIAYAILDIDGSPSLGNFRDWRDRVTITNAGATLSAVNSNYVQVTGLVATATGRNGNIGTTSTNGNVNVSIPNPTATIGFLYGPGPGDRFNSNQLIAISKIRFTANPPPPTNTPEPVTWLSVGVVLCGLGWRARRRGAS